ncbi:MAG: ester cyclase [Candidatus Dormibacteria bacterium]
MADYRQMAEDGWNAYYAHDADAMMRSYADDAEVTLPGMPPAQGKDAILAVWQMFWTAFPDEHATSIRHLVDGTTVVTEFTAEATHTGPLMMPTGDTLPPTGRRTVVRGCAVQEAVGDTMAKQTFYFDNLEFMQQLGVIPMPEGAAAG